MNWMTRIALAAALFAVVNVAPATASYTATRLANGRFDLQFSGLGAAQYVIQATTNFTNWTDLGFTQPTNGTLRFIDNAATNLPLRFYRVVSNLDLVTLSGTVRDIFTSVPVPNALVSTTLDSRTAVTDGNGLFSITTTVPATNSSFTYTVNVTAGGYNPAVIASNWPAHLPNLDMRLVPPPHNDNFANRIPLTGAVVNASAPTIGASRETGEMDHAGKTGGRSVWWTWTAPTTGEVTIDTVGSDFDTLLGVYRGTSLATLIEEASNDDTLVAVISSVTFTTVAGRVYQIAVDGFNAAAGNVQLNLLFHGPPANDRFVNQTALAGTNVVATGENFVATLDVGETNHSAAYGGAGGKSVWWSWTAPKTGPVTISTMGSDFDTVLAVYTGTTLANLSLVEHDNDSGDSGTSIVNFIATAGTIYRVAVDGFNPLSPTDYGNIVLTIAQP